MKIQALTFPEADKFEMSKLTLPDPGPEDIVVRTLVSAISPGTERWVLRGKHAGTKFPCVPGYHRIGIVEFCGKEVQNFQEGDVVYGSGNRWKEDIFSMWGAHVSHSVANCRSYKFIASQMPGRFELEIMAFTILAGVAMRGMNALDDLNGKRMLIIGGGFIGLCAAQIANLRGARPTIIDRDPERVHFAKRFADSFSVEDEKINEKLKQYAPEGFDVLHDTAGSAPTTDNLVNHLKQGGELLLQAQYFDSERCALDLDQLKIKEITIKTTCGFGSLDWLETFSLIRSRTLEIGPMITHRFDSDNILKGYELLSSGKPFNLGIVFNWQ